jgi:formamidopyrimidine-DNA glycosylase
MPELPEVETIKTELGRSVTGKRFIAITINDAKIVQNPIEAFSRNLIGQSIILVERRGKYIVFHLSSGKVMLMHMRMTGGVLLDPQKLDKFARVIFEMDDHSLMVFRDVRRFGTIELADDTSVIESKLGIDPLSEDFTVTCLQEMLKKRRAPIKGLLLEQKLIAGLGNMYADEALFAARIHPLREASGLAETEVERLHKAIKEVLRKAVECGGASVATYQKTDGSEGTAQCNFKVAHRQEEACYVCGSKLRRIVVHQRGTYYCPHCQKKYDHHRANY